MDQRRQGQEPAVRRTASAGDALAENGGFLAWFGGEKGEDPWHRSTIVSKGQAMIL